MPREKRPRMWLAKIFIGLGLLTVFVIDAINFAAFAKVAVHTQAKVLSVKHESHATGRRGGRVSIDRPFVSFTPPGQSEPMNAVAKVMSRREFNVGDEIPVAFDPSHPTDSLVVDPSLSVPDIAFGVVGFALLALALAEKWRMQRAR